MRNLSARFICNMFLLFGLFQTAQGQWYNRHYEVDQLDQLSEAQLKQAFSRAGRMHDAGRYVVLGSLIAGGVGALTGVAFYQYELKNNPDNYFSGLSGILIGYSAVLVSAVGVAGGLVPLIIGKSRINRLKAAFPNWTAELGVSPVMINGQPDYGVWGATLRINMNEATR